MEQIWAIVREQTEEGGREGETGVDLTEGWTERGKTQERKRGKKMEKRGTVCLCVCA